MVASSSFVAHALAVHARLVDVRKQRRQLDHQAALLLRQIDDERLFEALGYSNIFDYAEREHQVRRRPAIDLIRIARRIESLPATAAAFSAGELDKTKVRDIVSIATPTTEVAWVDRAKQVSSRVLERLVAAAGDDGLPPDEPGPKPLRSDRTTLVFHMHTAEADAVRAVIALLRAQCGPEGRDLDDGEFLRIMARCTAEHAELVHRPTNAEPYRIVLTQTSDGVRAGDAAVNETIADEACCDAVITDLRPGPKRGHSAHAIPPSARMITMAESDFHCAFPECRHRLFLDVHHIRGRDVENPHDPRNLVAICCVHHRLVHEGLVGVERRSDDKLVFHTRFGARVASSPSIRSRAHVGTG